MFQIGVELADDEHPHGERGGQNGRREARKQQRAGGDDGQLGVDQQHRLEERRIERGRFPDHLRLRRLRPDHDREHDVEGARHRGDVHEQRQQQPAILAQDELRAPDRLRQQRVNAAALDLFRHQADADEHGDEQAEEQHGRQAEIFDDLHVLPGGELSNEIRRAHQQDRECDKVVEHLVAHRFAEDVDRDGRHGSHRVDSAGAAGGRSATWRTKKSSSVSWIGLSETRCAPVAESSASNGSGDGSSGSSIA